MERNHLKSQLSEYEWSLHAALWCGLAAQTSESGNLEGSPGVDLAYLDRDFTRRTSNCPVRTVTKTSDYDDFLLLVDACYSTTVLLFAVQAIKEWKETLNMVAVKSQVADNSQDLQNQDGNPHQDTWTESNRVLKVLV